MSGEVEGKGREEKNFIIPGFLLPKETQIFTILTVLVTCGWNMI